MIFWKDFSLIITFSSLFYEDASNGIYTLEKTFATSLVLHKKILLDFKTYNKFTDSSTSLKRLF